MKDFIIYTAVFALLILILPMILTLKHKNMNKTACVYATALQTVTPRASDIFFDFKDGKTGKEMRERGFQFICGIVAGEMPASYNSEALKAQAVAAFTYCCYQKEHGGLKTGVNIAYLPQSEAQSKWGAKFADNWGKIELAVSEVYGKALFYNGKIINATFYDMSSGTTESCKDVFGDDFPYLVEISSPGDTLQKDFITHVSFTPDEFKAKVQSFIKNPDFSGDPANYLRVNSRSGAGGVISATLCGKTVSGNDIRSIFGLRSSNFSLAYANGKYNFEVKGYGHGVGMSQCGAEYMALQGKNYKEILLWYYKGANIADYLTKYE